MRTPSRPWRTRRTLADLGGPWRTLADLGGPWRTLADLGGPWRTSADLGGHCGALSFRHHQEKCLPTWSCNPPRMVWKSIREWFRDLSLSVSVSLCRCLCLCLTIPSIWMPNKLDRAKQAILSQPGTGRLLCVKKRHVSSSLAASSDSIGCVFGFTNWIGNRLEGRRAMRDRDGILDLQCRKAVLGKVRQTKSGLLVGSSACTMFSVWQNLNQHGKVRRARIHIIFCTIFVPRANVLGRLLPA